MNINEIKSQLTFGGARPSLFKVDITNPINGGADFKVPILAQAASLPADNIGVIEIPYMGRKIKQPGDRTFEEWTVTVMNDEDFLIRNALEEWMSAMNTHEGNIRIGGTSNQLKSQAQVTQLSKDNNPLRVYNFNGLFPTNISAIAVDWSTVDDIERFDVTFQYDWWNVSGGITGSANTNS